MAGDDAGGRLSWTTATGRRVAQLAGEIDLANAASLFAAIRAAPDGHDAIVIDLTKVTFLESVGIAELVKLAKETDVRVVSPAETMPARVLRITRLGDTIPIFPTVEDALATP